MPELAVLDQPRDIFDHPVISLREATDPVTVNNVVRVDIQTDHRNLSHPCLNERIGKPFICAGIAKDIGFGKDFVDLIMSPVRRDTLDFPMPTFFEHFYIPFRIEGTADHNKFYAFHLQQVSRHSHIVNFRHCAFLTQTCGSIRAS